LTAPVTDAALWEAIGRILPHIIVFFVTFAVLSVLWINHHFLFHSFAKSVDRRLNLLNLSYLSFVAFVPFSASIIGAYHTHQPAAIVYGLNIFVIVATSTAMVRYMIKHRGELLNDHVTPRLLNQAGFRAGLSLIFYALGMLITFVSVPLSLFFYAFPVIFNIIPGTLDFTEKMVGFDLGER
jgi:uncharacterized membrane protein